MIVHQGFLWSPRLPNVAIHHLPMFFTQDFWCKAQAALAIARQKRGSAGFGLINPGTQWIPVDFHCLSFIYDEVFLGVFNVRFWTLAYASRQARASGKSWTICSGRSLELMSLLRCRASLDRAKSTAPSHGKMRRTPSLDTQVWPVLKCSFHTLTSQVTLENPCSQDGSCTRRHSRRHCFFPGLWQFPALERNQSSNQSQTSKLKATSIRTVQMQTHDPKRCLLIFHV